ncbi:glycosyltransferase family 1 protein [Arcicella sp. LKC2W]|uniref:glycosyltransferase family 4 protein n=1 Tax=Arcicella sp. LKC2W TaxID=2984198 RepID=UPI002B20D933|nr:glycosyltransferase family 1 protein [Arcicella sp. LKC2W]MEA5461276.1 glycosyltransferase family 1 protein [Arcicella sp. LKC2W]
MAKADRKRIGFLMINDDLGVVYYLNNIVKSLSNLPDNDKPSIILFYDNTTQKHLSIFKNYNDIKFEKTVYPNLLKLYLLSIVTQTNYFINRLQSTHSLDGIFPVNDLLFKNSLKRTKLVGWITDFQHKFYPNFFSRFNRFVREFRFNKLLKNADDIVLSSEDTKSHLFRFYKQTHASLHVLNFVSHANLIQCTDSEKVLEKYNILKPFFIVSNQFYKHKNHIVVIKAIKNIVDKGYTDFEIVFTGKKEDYRDKTFYPKIEKFIKEYKIENNVKILGLIPREEQLSLLKSSVAIIQPSFFEGWNTSIEDAKTLQKQVICSDIEVHEEQMGDKAYYFNPENDLQLANILMRLLLKNIKVLPIFDNFNDRVNQFSSKFIQIFDEN